MATTTPSAQQATARRPGLKGGQVNEFTLTCPLKPGGADRMRNRLPDGFTGAHAQATDRIGTVHDLRCVIFDNDMRVLFAPTYEGDFKPYIVDILQNAGPWFDEMFTDVVEGWPGS